MLEPILSYKIKNERKKVQYLIIKTQITAITINKIVPEISHIVFKSFRVNFTFKILDSWNWNVFFNEITHQISRLGYVTMWANSGSKKKGVYSIWFYGEHHDSVTHLYGADKMLSNIIFYQFKHRHFVRSAKRFPVQVFQENQPNRGFHVMFGV